MLGLGIFNVNTDAHGDCMKNIKKVGGWGWGDVGDIAESWSGWGDAGESLARWGTEPVSK